MSETPLFHALSAVVGGSDTASDGELLQRFADADDRTAELKPGDDVAFLVLERSPKK